MKKLKMIFEILAFVVLINSQAYSWIYFCIDPGHGGIQSGNVGRVYGLLEKHVNLGVGLIAYNYFGSSNWNAMLTRDNDTVTMYPTQRADTANNANYGSGVDAFISIHHNADSLITDTITNGTETFWCNADSTDNHLARNKTHLLADKTYFKLRDEFHYPERGVKITCWDVLRLTKMASTLSEASFLSCAKVERKFYYDFDDECANEADAIWRASISYWMHKGIAIVKNSYSGGNAGRIIVSKWDWMQDECFDTDTVNSPFYDCWVGGILGEAHCLQAITPQWLNGYECNFNHWSHLDNQGYPVENCYDPLWKFEVNYFETDSHRYVAYYTGGYSAQVSVPNGGENWHPGEQRNIVWDVSIGADSSTNVYVYLDRNGGNDGYPECLGWWYAKYNNHYTWTVTSPYSSNCKIKVVATDVAGNSASDVTDSYFFISASGNNNPVIDGRIHCKYPQEECRQCFHFGDSRTLEINAHDPDGDSMYYEWWCGPSPWGGHFSNGQNHIFTPQNYVVYTAPPPGKYESDTLFKDHLSVGVSDIRGGQTPEYEQGDVVLTSPGYPCRCGDANGSQVVEVGDVVTLLNYLYKGFPEYTLCAPKDRADANNSCDIEIGDITILLSYLFHGLPLTSINCCWIHLIDRR
jgi:hypothetical protein